MNSVSYHLTEKNPALSWLHYLLHVSLIVSAIAICEKVSFLFFPLAVVLIASRFYALALTGHEGVHLLLFKSRWANLWFTRVFCHFPILISTSHFSHLHLTHHRFLGTERDPDILIYQRSWRSMAGAFGTVMREFLTGRLFLDFCIYFNGIPQKIRGEKTVPWTEDFIWLVLFWVAILAAVAMNGLWMPFVLYWFVPVLFMMAWLPWVNVYQHYHPQGPKPDHAYNGIFRSGFLNWLMFPLNSAYHEVHHRHPGVPCRHLKDPALGEAVLTQVSEINQKMYSDSN